MRPHTSFRSTETMTYPGKPRRLAGRAFYTTVLAISLLAVYSFLKPTYTSHPSRLNSRSLDTKDIECRLVYQAEDKCAFIFDNCLDEETGLISYLQFYYCSLSNVPPVAFAILVLWLGLLFSTIGIAASDFLCINLNTIATVLGMSESLTGVTFLAFGNGSPDVFSTFAAMSNHSGSLAVGELIGAACFITAVVAGSMAIVRPFQVAKKSFVRDVGFFVVAASFSMYFLLDGRLQMWEAATMVGFYAFYVAFVVAWHWWLGNRRRKRVREATARSHQHIPHTQELEINEIEDDIEAAPTGERTPLMRGYSGEDFSGLESGGTPAWDLQDVSDDDEARDRYLAELRSNMRVSRAGRGERRNTMTPIRPSLVGALEFRSVLNTLEKSRSSYSNPINLRRYSDDPSNTYVPAEDGTSDTLNPGFIHPSSSKGQDSLKPGSNAGSRGRAATTTGVERLRLDTSLLDVNRPLDSAAISITSDSPGPTPGHRSRSQASNASGLSANAPPQLLISPPGSAQPSRRPSPGPLPPHSPDHPVPSTSAFHDPNHQEGQEYYAKASPRASPVMSPGLGVPAIKLPHPERKHSASRSPYPSYTDSPQMLSPSSSRAPSIRLPPASLSADSVPDSSFIAPQIEDQDDEMRTFKWWPYAYLPPPQVIVSTLFPTVYSWRGRSIMDKVVGVLTVPPVFLLTITLPVVELDQDESMANPDPGLLSPAQHPHHSITPASETPTNRATQGSEATSLPTQKAYTQTVDAAPDSKHMGTAPGPKDWNRWLVFVQVFTAPLFVVLMNYAGIYVSLSQPLKTFNLLILGSLLFSMTCLLFLLATTSPDRPPKFRPLLCFLGFAVSIAWISAIANEVVGLLKAFGVILGISDAVLGLTIFAIGNSLGDLVADITVARLGFPVMALSACFGGPMLNILLGIGVSGLYMTLRHGKHGHKHSTHSVPKAYDIEISTTLVISGITLLVTLLGLLIVVPLNGWRLDRKIGFGLIALWTVSTAGNVLVESLGYGGDLAQTMWS